MKKFTMLFVAAMCATFAWAKTMDMPAGPAITVDNATRMFTITPAAETDRYLFFAAYVNPETQELATIDAVRATLTAAIESTLAEAEIEDLNYELGEGVFKGTGTMHMSVIGVGGSDDVPAVAEWLILCQGFAIQNGVAVPTTMLSEAVFTTTEHMPAGPAISGAGTSFTVTPASATGRYFMLVAPLDGDPYTTAEEARVELQPAFVDFYNLDEEDVEYDIAEGVWKGTGTMTMQLANIVGEARVTEGDWYVVCQSFEVIDGYGTRYEGPAYPVSEFSECVFSTSATGVSVLSLEEYKQKMLRNGQLVIRHGDKLINAVGAVVE